MSGIILIRGSAFLGHSLLGEALGLGWGAVLVDTLSPHKGEPILF
jgi:hypothetical protein